MIVSLSTVGPGVAKCCNIEYGTAITLVGYNFYSYYLETKIRFDVLLY